MKRWLRSRRLQQMAARSRKFRDQLYGGSIGGPIRRDKTFFNLSYERQSFIIGLPEHPTGPVDRLSELRHFDCSSQHPGGVYGNYAPISVNPVSLNLLQNLMAGERVNRACQSEQLLQPWERERDTATTVLRNSDHSFNEKNQISLSVFV